MKKLLTVAVFVLLAVSFDPDVPCPENCLVIPGGCYCPGGCR